VEKTVNQTVKEETKEPIGPRKYGPKPGIREKTYGEKQGRRIHSEGKNTGFVRELDVHWGRQVYEQGKRVDQGCMSAEKTEGPARGKYGLLETISQKSPTKG